MRVASHAWQTPMRVHSFVYTPRHTQRIQLECACRNVPRNKLLPTATDFPQPKTTPSRHTLTRSATQTNLPHFVTRYHAALQVDSLNPILAFGNTYSCTSWSFPSVYNLQTKSKRALHHQYSPRLRWISCGTHLATWSRYASHDVHSTKPSV